MMSGNHLGHLAFARLQVLRVQRSIGKDKVVKRAVVDDTVH